MKYLKYNRFMYMYNNHFAVNLKLTHYYTSTILQYKIKKKNKMALNYFAWSLLEHQQELTS